MRQKAGLTWFLGCRPAYGLIAICLLGSLAATARATLTASTQPAAGIDPDADNPHLWKPRVKAVAVFKNGFGFFMREGEVALRDGWCVAEDVPPAVFGTLAVYSQRDNEVIDVVGHGPGEIVDFDDRDAPSNIGVKRARLEAAANLNVSLTYLHKGANRSASGTLVSVGPEFAVLESDAGTLAVPLAGLQRMQTLGMPLRVHVDAGGDDAPERTALGMAYLRKGITWIPEYTVKLLDDESAELTLRGTLVNEAEDLIHCDVNFVVGVPHFLHTEYLAPIAIGQALRTIGSAVAPPELATQLLNRAAIASNSFIADQFVHPGPADPSGTGDINAVLGNLPMIGGAAATDYTVYTKQDLTLRRGEKAIVTLFVKRITYTHVYRWSPPEQMQHYLVLQNTTDTAWTTGPYLAVSGDRPLSEDLLRYTPRGGNCEIPVTTAVNVAHDKAESETDRQLKTHEPSHNVFLDLVTLEGRLSVRNFEKRRVDIVIQTPVEGKPLSASDEGAMSVDVTRLGLRERIGSIHWRIQLDPGQGKVLTYTYQRYVASN